MRTAQKIKKTDPMDFYNAIGFKPMERPRLQCSSDISTKDIKIFNYYQIIDRWLERILPAMLKIIIGYWMAHIIVAILRYII